MSSSVTNSFEEQFTDYWQFPCLFVRLRWVLPGATMYMANQGCLADVEKMILHAKLGCEEYQWNAQPYTHFVPQFRSVRFAEVYPNVPSTILRVPLLPDQHPVFHIGSPARL